MTHRLTADLLHRDRDVLIGRRTRELAAHDRLIDRMEAS